MASQAFSVQHFAIQASCVLQQLGSLRGLFAGVMTFAVMLFSMTALWSVMVLWSAPIQAAVTEPATSAESATSAEPATSVFPTSGTSAPSANQAQVDSGLASPPALSKGPSSRLIALTPAVLTLRSSDQAVFNSAHYKTCFDRLGEANVMRFTRDRHFARQIQQKIALIYRDNKDFRENNERKGGYLTDSIFGEVTQKWAAYFCSEFRMKVQSNAQGFVVDLLSDLSRVAELSQIYPFWRARLSPDALLRQTYQQSQAALEGYRKESQRFALPSHHARPVKSLPDLPFYYRLTQDDLALLAERNGVIQQLDDLVDQQFGSRLEANNAIRPLLKSLIRDYESELEHLVTSQTLVLPGGETGTGGEKDQNGEKDQDGKKGKDGEKNQDDEKGKDGEKDDSGGADDEATASPVAPATQTLFVMSRTALQALLDNQSLALLDDATLESLQVLQGRVFALQYQFNVALRLAGLDELEHNARVSLDKLAFKQGIAEQQAPPLVWQPTEDCGCSVGQVKINGERNVFYGFYPYWANAEADRMIDFSQLSRIGYFSAAIVPGQKGTELKLPQNWRKARPYSEFVYQAHKHKVKVDLVVSSPRTYAFPEHQPSSDTGKVSSQDKSQGDEAHVQGAVNEAQAVGVYDWRQEVSGVPEAPVLSGLYSETLIDQLVDAVKVPLDNYWINRAKPVLSFGTSPMRTMADGVTLDFDLSRMTDYEDQVAFQQFIILLKQKLSATPEQWHNGHKVRAGHRDAYFLNMMVPVRQLTAGKGFFTLDNLEAIAPYVNQFILTLDQPDMPDHIAAGVKPGGNHELDQIRDFRRFLSLKPQKEMAWLFSKMVPVLLTQDNRSNEVLLKELVDYSRWSFSGAAYWTLPLSPADRSIISQTYFPTVPAEGLTGIASELVASTCDWLCPERWTLRTILFLLFITVVLLVVSAVWFYQLRAMVKSGYFALFVAVMAGFVMLVFNCDPYWREHQSLIFFVFVLLLLLIGGLVMRHKSREGRYP